MEQPTPVLKITGLSLETVNHLYSELAKTNHKVFYLHRDQPNLLEVNKIQRDLLLAKLGLTLETKKVMNYYLKDTNEKVTKNKLNALLLQARAENGKVDILLTHRSFGRLDFYQKCMILDFINVRCDEYTEVDFRKVD